MAPSLSPAMPLRRQCEWGVTTWTLLSLAAHFASLFFRSKGRHSKIGITLCGGLAVLGIVVVELKGVEKLYYMHQVIGMVAFEYAAITVRMPMVMATSASSVIGLLIFVIPMLMVVAGEVTDHRFEQWRWSSPYWQWFLDSRMYKKHHAFLHATVAIALVSASTSYVPRWRHSFRVQLARMFMEPTCIVTIAALLFVHNHEIHKSGEAADAHTHTHTGMQAGSNQEKLSTHPVVASMICVASFVQFAMVAAHIPHAPLEGGLPDLAKMTAGEGPPSLLVWRLTSTFAWLVLAYFLYVDYYFEYLDCRADFFGEPGSRRNAGYSLGSEVASYMACSFILAVFTLVVMIFTLLPVRGAARDCSSDSGERECSDPSYSTIECAEPETCDKDSCHGVL
mmetsp:Transcript_140589/g.350488  ORF Transcript_140589/g.350488 Transcript_140589/m.350488 type:complete len:394 (-) Transcript_140589:232-1413(-)